MSKKILITGGCGFVGSNLAILIKEKHKDYEITCFDNLKRRGSELSILRLKESDINFVHGDLRNKEDFDQLNEFNLIIDAAAEPSVLAGLNGGLDYLINTNLYGTFNTLNLANRLKADFIFLSTSRVYPIKKLEDISYNEIETRFEMIDDQNLPGVSSRGISEQFPMNGSRSFYGASKLSSELLVEEFNELCELRTVINRCGVITGPWQMGKVDQGVVVLWLAKHYWKSELNYIGYGGEGKQVRDILHIHDLFDIIDYQIHHMEEVNGDIFNIGGGRNISISLQELTDICEQVTGNKINIGKIQETRKADARIYITDNSKITTQTGWVPKISPTEIIKDIFNWVKTNEKDLRNILR